MSFNFALAYLPHTKAESLGILETDAASFSEASSATSGAPSVAQFGEHVLIVDPTNALLDEAPAGATVVGLSGVSDVYVLRTADENARLLVYMEGEEVENEGVPLDAEAVLAGEEFPEDGFFSLFLRVAHATQDDLDLLEWRRISPRVQRRRFPWLGRRR